MPTNSGTILQVPGQLASMQFSSDDHFKGQEVGANARHGASEVCPLAGHSMGECCMSSMRLGECNGSQLF